jgi:hypothetical protein
MQLQLAATSETSVQAGYACTCGCTPSVVYERDSAEVDDTCCCGTHFVVGRDAESHLDRKDGFRTEVQEFVTPWGDSLEAAWAIGSGHHPD